MASYGILGFLGGAGEAGAEFAKGAKENQYREAAAEKLEHNEQARIKMAQAFEQKTYERGRADDLTDYGVQRKAQLADQTTQRSYQVEDATTASLDADRRAREASASAAAQSETDFDRKMKLERLKIANKPGLYSDLATGVNPATGKTEQYRINDRTGAPEFTGIEFALSPKELAEQRKAEAGATIAETKVSDAAAKEQTNLDLKDSAITQIDKILDPSKEDSFNAVIGPLDSSWASPTFRPGSSTMKNDLSDLRKMIKLDKIKIMAGMGSLTEAEGEAIEKAFAAGLDPSSSQESVRASLISIREKLVRERQRQAKSAGVDRGRSASDQSSGASGGWNDSGVDEERASSLANKYGL